MYKDFLGNEVVEGDLVIYSPSTQSNELVLAEVLTLTSDTRWEYRYDKETGEEGRIEVEYFKPTLQPLSGTSSYRFRGYKDGKHVDIVARKVTLADCSGLIFHSKKGN